MLFCTVPGVVGPLHAATMHAEVPMLTYTDFAANKGRYAVGNLNALQTKLRENGITIAYTGGHPSSTLEHEMIDFSSMASNGASAAIGINFIATVHHNGVQNPTFSSSGIQYQGIEHRNADIFILKPDNDYKITRLSKIITDVTGSTVYGSTTGKNTRTDVEQLEGQLLYRAGQGVMYLADTDGTQTRVPGGYATGGIAHIFSVVNFEDDGSFSTTTNWYSYSPYVREDPLPFVLQAGDSGSPTWVWNTDTQQYEYLNAGQSGNGTFFSQERGNVQWTAETMTRFDKAVTVGADNTICLYAASQWDGDIYDSATEATGAVYSGAVTNASGEELVRYNGIQSGVYTWDSLTYVRDTENWYRYDDKPMPSAGDLFNTENLLITAASDTETQYVVLKETVDLGVGYVQFRLGEGMKQAEFVVEGVSDPLWGTTQLNSAGYVVDKGASVHVKLTNAENASNPNATYTREWRKTGEGDLYLEGSGNNAVLLNLGGSGTTYLRQSEGYAAYNVLVNNGAKVQIEDIDQIARDFTFGNCGGTLDMNGNSMKWNNGNSAGAAGFTIHALDEGAVITNSSKDSSTLTWTQGGNQTWLGSFTDAGQGALKFVYNGGSGSSLQLHSIYTHLQQPGSGMEVQSGSVTLAGTITQHGKVLDATGQSTIDYVNQEDWHYADAAMNVTVGKDAAFELGSHARLTGNVTVEDGGTFIMREGVMHRMEYIEGGYEKEDTDAIRAYFGLKGNVSLSQGARMQVEFGEDTDSTLEYGGSISGSGSVSVTNARLVLTGESSHSGGTTLSGGSQVTLAHATSAGTGAISLSDEGSTLIYAGSEARTSHSTLDNAIGGKGSVQVGSGALEFNRSMGYTGKTSVAVGASLKLSARQVSSSSYEVEKGAELRLSGQGDILLGGMNTMTLMASCSDSSDAVVENAVITGNAILSADGTRGSLRDALISTSAAEFSLTQMDICGSMVELNAASALLHLSQATLSGDTQIFGSSAGASVKLDGVVLTLRADSLRLPRGTGATYTLDTFSDVGLAGNLQLDAGALGLSAGTAFALDFGDSVELGRLAVSLDLGGTVLTQYQQTGSVLVFSVPGEAAVPEPATATLSLLALAGLAARRRRK